MASPAGARPLGAAASVDPGIARTCSLGGPTFTAMQLAVLAWLRDEREVLERIPRPGHGRTVERWRYLATTSANDASRARLAEGHLDAVAILEELGRSDLRGPEQLWGVWAAEPAGLRAERTTSGWNVSGTKRWCSGSIGLDAVLLTAMGHDGPLLFAAPTSKLSVVDASWQPLGMVATASHTLTFDQDLAPDCLVGGAGSYVSRPGFWHGGAGVAVCWYGAAVAVAGSLLARSQSTDDAYLAAAAGRCRAVLDGLRALLRAAADDIDRSPLDSVAAQRRAMGVRVAVEDGARRILEMTVAVLGANALCHDHDHIAKVADLTVYLGQHHGDRDAAAYGRVGAPTESTL